MQRQLSLGALFPVALLCGACLTNPLDPDATGVFVCEDNEECPSGQACLQGFCESGPLPKITITSPEAEPLIPYDPDAETVDLPVFIGGDFLDLIDQNSTNEARPGTGFLVIEVDGVEVETIDEGDIGSGVETTITLDNTVGAHRLRVRARMHDDSNYDNVEAHADRILWIDDGGSHVAIRNPWPNDVYDQSSQLVQVEIASIRVDIGAPLQDPDRRHVHIFYDLEQEDIVDCLAEPSCFNNYQGVVPSQEDPLGPIQLPEEPVPGAVRISAVLVDFDHMLFMPETPISDTIEIVRLE